VLKGAAAALVLVATSGHVWPGEARVAQAGAAPVVRLYDDNPSHLWNRLHAALFVRVADGREYGTDRVDPLLWIGSKHLLQGASHERAVQLIHEFLDNHGETRVRDPLKRAMLQRDLWTVFDWLQGTHGNFAQPRLSEEAVRRGVEDLSAPIGAAIGRLALSPGQIDALPDNYAAAARAGLVPADLFSPRGPWVSVGRDDGPVAVNHVGDLGVGRNSVFLVFIKLPGGRDATLRYVQRLHAYSGPFRTASGYPSPDIPQFPAGTEVALVRRALLIDSDGRIVATRIVEQVQHRLYREIPPWSPQELDLGAGRGQEVDDVMLSRAALFAGHAGGLVSMDAAGPLFLTFSDQGLDAFEMKASDPSFEGGRRRTLGMNASEARKLCATCHVAPGVYSFNSYLPFRLLSPEARPSRLSEISMADAVRFAVQHKPQRAEWRALQTLMRR